MTIPSPGLHSVGVVGAGIVGLAVSRELTRRLPGVRVTVLEAEDHVAAHQTSHNSGVVHAGLYYQPGSLKAQLCRRGSGLLRDFCGEHGIDYREVGKVVVATDDAELPMLAQVEQRARTNGVPNLRRLTAAGLREIEPQVAGVAALHSPHTAVVDFVAVCNALAKEVEGAGGQVLLSAPVRRIRPRGAGVEVVAGQSVHGFDVLVSCAGLGTDRIGQLAGARPETRIVPFRGEYYRLVPSVADRVRGLIYPVPDPRYPFLGVHLTRSVRDDVLVGPNAVLALALDGYDWGRVSPRDLATLATWPGTWRMGRQHWRTGLREMGTSLSRKLFAGQAARYLPGLRPEDLQRAPAGVRAQAVDRAGRLADDFVIQDVGPITLVRNAPSPAATSSLAIAEHLVDRLLR
jgi:L-2-hydroxyglutarate oxidase LhgO